MTIYLESGWEDSGGSDITDNGKWDGGYSGSTPTVSSSNPKSGTYHLSQTVSAYGGSTLSKNYTGISEIYVQEEVYLSAMPSDYEIVQLFKIGGATSDIAEVTVYNEGGTLKWGLFYQNGGSYVTYNYSTMATPSSGVYHKVKLHVICSGSTAEYHLYIDDVELTDIAKTGMNSVDSTATWIHSGIGYSDIAVTLYTDDTIIADTDITGGTPQLVDEYSSTNYNSDVYLSQIFGSGATNCGHGQCFTVDSEITLSSASFYLYKSGSPTGVLKAYLYALSGSYGSTGIPTGSILATSDNIDMSTVAGGGMIEFTFSTPYVMSAGNYCIVIVAYSGTVDGSNLIGVGVDSSSPTHDGNYFYWNNTVWSYNASNDLIFNVYGVSGTSTVATPTFNPPAGNYGSQQSVTISCATSGADIYYTTDGSTPDSGDTLYSSSITVDSNMTLKAIGIKSGYTDSDVAVATYTIGVSGSRSIGSGTFGNAWTSGSPEALVDLIADAGGQNIIMWAGDDAVNYNTMYSWTNSYNGETLTYEQFLLRIRTRCTTRGIKLGLQWVFYSQDVKRNIVNNVSGIQDTYISVYSTIVDTFQPDFVDILNETVGDLGDGTGSSGFLSNYQSFCEDCIDALRTVSDLGNDLIAVISGVPFWRLAYVTSNPINRTNCVYAVHAYYTWGDNPPAEWELWNNEYYYGTTEEDFVYAKTLLYDDLLNQIGITNALAAGLEVFVEESGSYIGAPNYIRAMTDYWDICNEYNLSFDSQCSGGEQYYIPQFNSSGELTAIGDVWVAHLVPIVVATPTFDPVGGIYGSQQSVTISCATSGATIYYTTDGSTPDSSDTEYTGAISVTSTTTIKAIAIKFGYDDSAVASATYTINIVTVSGNGAWYQGNPSNLTQSYCETLKETHGIGEIYPQIGQWQSDGSIYELGINPSDIQAGVAGAHAAGIKILPWIIEDYYSVPISTEGGRNTCIASMVSLCDTYGFDGVADDLEIYHPTADYIAFWNASKTALNAEGYLYYTTIQSWYNYGVFSNSELASVNVDKFQIMAYDMSIWSPYSTWEDTFKAVIAKFIDNVTCPSSIALSHTGVWNTQVSWANSLAWTADVIASNGYGSLMGIDIFEIAFTMDSSEWAAWDAWTIKDAFVGSSSPESIDSYGPSNHDSDATLSQIFQSGNINCAYGQTFTVTENINLTSIDVYSWWSGSPSGILRAYIYNITGTHGTNAVPTGSILATSDDVAVIGDLTFDDIVTFNFSSPYLSAGTYAFAIVAYSGTYDGSNLVGLWMDSSSPTHDGNYFYWNNTNWSADNTKDLIFSIYGTTSSGVIETKTYSVDTILEKLNTTLTYNIDLILKKLDTSTTYSFDSILKKLDTILGYSIDTNLTTTIPTIDFYVSQISNIDSVADIGTHSNFSNQQDEDLTYDTLTEVDDLSGLDSTPEIIDDFEDGGTAPFGWSSSDGTVIMSTDYAHGGSYSMRAYMGATSANNWSALIYSFGTNRTEMYIEGWIYTSTPPDISEDQRFFFLGENNNAYGNVYGGIRNISGSYYWTLWAIESGTTFVTTTSGTAFLPDTWYHVKIGLYRNAGAGFAKLWVNDMVTPIISRTSLSNTGRACNYARIGYSYSDAPDSEHAYVYIDDVRIVDVEELPNYRLELEEEIDNLEGSTGILHIVTGDFSGAENLDVYAWDGAIWQLVIDNCSANTDNYIDITDYISGGIVYILFKDGTVTSDTIQNSWEVDAVYITMSGASTTQNYFIDAILKELDTLKTYSTDLLIQRLSDTDPYSIDTIIQQIKTNTYDVDTLIKKLDTLKTYSIDSINKKLDETKTYLSDTLLKEVDHILTPNGCELWLSLNEGIGSIVYDKSGKEHNSVINGATWNSNELTFDGVNDGINSITYNPDPFINNELTYITWIKLHSIDNFSGQTFLGRDYDGAVGDEVLDPTYGYVRRAQHGIDSAGYLIDGITLTANMAGNFAFTILSKCSDRTSTGTAWTCEMYEDGNLFHSYSMNFSNYNINDTWQWKESSYKQLDPTKTYTVKLKWEDGGTSDLQVYLITTMDRRGGIGFYPNALIFEKTDASHLQVGFYSQKSDLTYSYVWWSSNGLAVFDDQWHMIGVTLKDGIKSLYLDGDLVTSTSGCGDLNTYTSVGIAIGNIWGYLYGSMKNIMAFSYGLSDIEMKSIYDNEIYSYSLDTIFKEIKTSNYLIESLTKTLDTTKTYSVDQLISVINTTTYNIDTIINKLDTTSTYSFDTLIQELDRIVPLNGCLLWFPMDEGSGSYIYDKSNNSNTGSITGASWVSGKYNTGLYFDGSDYVTVTDTSALRMVATDFSVSFWINPEDEINTYQGIICKGTANSSGWSITYYGTTHTINFWCSDGTAHDYLATSNKVPVSTLTHCIVVYEYNAGSPTVSFYFNGIFDKTLSCATIASGSINLHIGWTSSGWNKYFTGLIDEVAIFTKALNENEITALYNNQMSSYNIDVAFRDTATINYITDVLTKSLDNTVTYSVDEILELISANTYNIDVILKKLDTTQTYSLESLLSEINTTLTYSIDTIFSKIDTLKTYIVDMIIKKLDTTTTYSVDELIKEIDSLKTYSIDTILYELGSITFYDVDVLLQKATSINYLIDSALSEIDNISTYDLDILIQKINSDLYDIDTLLSETRMSNYLTDVYIKDPTGLSTYHLDTLIKKLDTIQTYINDVKFLYY